MDAPESKPSLTQRRILWWMATTGERPFWISGRASWEGGQRSTTCPYGLGRPHLPRLSIEAMLDAGCVVIRSESFAANVISLARADRGALLEGPEAHRQRIVLTDLGRRLAPKTPPFPWRPNIGGTSDMTLCEGERQRKIAAFDAARRGTHMAPARIVATFGRHP